MKKTVKAIHSPSNDIKVEMKLEILKTIGKSIYSSPVLKIREAVSNSIDNNASSFILYADRSATTLSLFDNGTGITKERFKEIFSSLGYGLLRDKHDHNSYFGLGLMSIIQLGETAKIFSKSPGNQNVIMLTIDSKKIFDDSNANKPLSFLLDCIKMKEVDLKDRSAESSLENQHIEDILKEFPETFTEIIIENVKKDDFEYLTNLSFIEYELRKILPLKPDEKDPLLSCIKDKSAKNWILNTLKNTDYCPTINFHFGINEEREIKQLSKYFPDFKQDLKFESTNIMYGESKNKDFAFYVVFTTQDLESKQKDNPETGFWIRNHNFLVKPADYFQEPGSKKKFIHEPLKNWLFGEVFHKNMNHFLTVAKNDYVWNSTDFTSFRDEVIDRTSNLNQKLRKAWKYGKDIIDSVINPLREIDETTGPFSRAKDTFVKMGVQLKEQGESDNILSKLNDRRKKELENESNRVDMIIGKSKNEIILSDDENSLVILDPKIKDDLFEQYLEQNNSESCRVVVRLSPSLFQPKRVIFLDKTFEMYFVHGKDADPGFSINSKEGKIYVNIFNHDLMKYSVSFIDVYIAVELADILSSDKKSMKYYILKLLGAKYNDSSKYLTSLADDLQRKKRSN